jgi:hypothetical protein
MNELRSRKRDHAAWLGVYHAERDILDLYFREVSKAPVTNPRCVISVAQKYHKRGLALASFAA